MRFQEGDIVKIAKTCSYYTDNDAPDDPKDTEGIVLDPDNGGNVIVEWTLNIQNTYDELDLRLVRRPE